jgi:hypothetical protein
MSRYRQTLFVLAFMLSTWGAAWAQLDPDPDGLGVYFDQEATLVVATAEPLQTGPGPGVV